MRNHFLFVVFLIFSSIFQIHSQNNLNVVSKSGNNVNLQISQLEPLDLLSHDPDSVPHYRFFWIFGDGAFLIDSIYSNMGDTISHVLPYTYPGSGNYSAVTYLTELYSNHRPPRLTSPVNINIISKNVDTMNHFNQVVPQGRKIGMITNHNNRYNYETVNVIGSKPDYESKRILFFYGSKIDNGTAVPVSDSFNYQRTHFANYSNSNLLESKSTVEFDTLNNTSFHSDYDSVLIYSIDSLDMFYNRDENDELEHRLFHVLKTMAEMDENQDYRFLSILTSASEYNKENLIGYNNWSKIDTLLNNSDQIGVEYVEDFCLSESPVLGPHDPNHLELLRIYKYGQDKFKLEFELEYCNDGKGPAQNIFIRLIDEQLEYEDYKIDDVRFKGNTFTGSWDDVLAGDDDIYGLNFVTQLPEKSIVITPPDSCGYVQFTVSTNALGVNNLLNRKSKMKACVSFFGFENDELCAYWEFSPKDKPDVINCENNCILCNNTILYLLIGMILLLLLVLIFCCFIKK